MVAREFADRPRAGARHSRAGRGGGARPAISPASRSASPTPAIVDPQSGVRNNVVAALYGNSDDADAPRRSTAHHALIRALAAILRGAADRRRQSSMRSIGAVDRRACSALVLPCRHCGWPRRSCWCCARRMRRSALVARAAPALNLMVVGSAGPAAGRPARARRRHPGRSRRDRRHASHSGARARGAPGAGRSAEAVGDRHGTGRKNRKTDIAKLDRKPAQGTGRAQPRRRRVAGLGGRRDRARRAAARAPDRRARRTELANGIARMRAPAPPASI